MRASRLCLAAILAALLTACGGSGGGSTPPSSPAPVAHFLTAIDVQRIIAQAVGEAQARGERAHVVVVDRVGNVLATFEMNGAIRTLEIGSGLGVAGGLDGLSLPAPYASYSAIAKAVTAAYLSSGGNAFSTRTAGQIVQENFNPGESQQPSGPLYGVQFSQLRCSDLIRTVFQASLGPKPSPFGLAADPGGLPLYKQGVLVGGIGIESNGRYGLDRNVTDVDQDPEEIIAVAGAYGFAAPSDIRAERITADGRSFRFVDSESLASNPASPAAFDALPGRLAIALGFTGNTLRAGAEYGTAASGIRRGAGSAWILVDEQDRNRYAPKGDDRAPGLAQSEVGAILDEAMAVASRTRAQIRRPLGSAAQVSIAVIGLEGGVLGLVRSPDAPVFGIDVAVQKARTAAFFSNRIAHVTLGFLDTVDYAPRAPAVALPQYLHDVRAFLGDPQAFTGTTAWTSRAIGNLHRPTFPDGLSGSPHGPLSTPAARWSPFNPGFQLDLIFKQFVQAALNVSETKNCVQPGLLGPVGVPPHAPYRTPNGIQVFPGGVPIYRGAELIGAIGVSGDGVDQDDMIAFLGIHNAAARLGTGFGNAPAAMRADRLTPQGTRLRYVQCPQSPFLDSSEQDVCAGK